MAGTGRKGLGVRLKIEWLVGALINSDVDVDVDVGGTPASVVGGDRQGYYPEPVH